MKTITINGKKYQEVLEKSRNGKYVTEESKYNGQRPDWSNNVARASVEIFRVVGLSELSYTELVNLIEEQFEVRNAVAQGMISDYVDPNRKWKIFKRVGKVYSFNY